ncbi:MAG: hypothetical protein RMJ98_12445 [Myxococcales bacterium]|nr:hypothetical protein [Polyangiaceae bacterium]MDW8250096.1 hypothetical protein [Myxococcales bacterium]
MRTLARPPKQVALAATRDIPSYSLATIFGSPRKLPKPQDLPGRVVVLDIAFASEAGGQNSFQKITLSFLHKLGPRLAAWVDHHDSVEHARFRHDPRFILRTKAEHGACPEIITPELVERIGPWDTIVCHNDFDGAVSAAKWRLGGLEPYPGADEDARAVDTRVGKPGPIGERFDRAIRARPRDLALMGLIVRHLSERLADASLWEPIDLAARELDAIEANTRKIAERYARIPPGVALVDASDLGPYDKTLLLLLGQEREPVSVVIDRQSVTLAAAFNSGINFLSLLGLSGGMPTRVSVDRSTLPSVWKALGVDPTEAERTLDR